MWAFVQRLCENLYFFSLIHNVWNTAVLHMASCVAYKLAKLALYSAVSYDWCSSICLFVSCNQMFIYTEISI